MEDKYKLHPRNTTAAEATRISGNPVTTLLESGVGNCFPGLECDIRNLERRFFPRLAVDFTSLSTGNNSFSTAVVNSVDITDIQTSNLSPDVISAYETIAEDIQNPNTDTFWFLSVIRGNFGPFGDLDLKALDIENNQSDFDKNDVPEDAWTAIRLLPEGQDVTIVLRTSDLQRSQEITLPRISYLDKHGALDDSFQTGEMTQSLCSPWIHDFRDCGCFYWASNHPDISLQPSNNPDPDQDLDRPALWQRGERGSPSNPAPPADANGPARNEGMQYYEIHERWQDLGIVLDGREQGDSYIPSQFDAEPFASIEELEQHVRYAAGVELALTLEYLSAAYSLDRQAAGGTLADDVMASFAEVLRIAIGEMKHMRAANDLLRALSERGLITSFSPALQIVAELPAGGGATRPLAFRPLTQATLSSFIDIERPSFSVDGLYGRILATVKMRAPGPLEALVQSIMADGTDHFETFSFVKEWLGRHGEEDYLLNDIQTPDDSVPEYQTLQERYQQLLEILHTGYSAGLPGGATAIGQARDSMLAVDGIRDICEALASQGFQIIFETPDDARFEALSRP